MTALDDVKTAQAELHASTYWKPGSRGWQTTHLYKCDVALQAALKDLAAPVPGPTPTPTPTPIPVTARSLAPWNPGSAFATPIPASPPIHPDSASIIAAIFAPQGPANYQQNWLGPRGGPGLGAAAAIAYPDAATPLVTVQINYPRMNDHLVHVPIPAGFKVGPTAHSENKASILLPDGTQWDFFDITPPGAPTFDYTNEAGYPGNAGNQYWQALNGWHHPAGWASSAVTPGYPWSDSDIMHSVGIIRRRDIEQTPAGGDWGHALTIGFTGNTDGTNGWPRHVAPATSGDGKNAGEFATPMGARFFLDPTIDVDTWPSSAAKPEWFKQMLRTMQRYGVITAHTAYLPQGNGDGIWTEWWENLGGWYFPWQSQADGSVANYYDPALNVPADLLARFHVLDWAAAVPVA